MYLRFIVALCGCALAASMMLACGTHRASTEGGARPGTAPARCGSNRIGAGWVETRLTIAPVSFCLPPGLQLVPGKQLLASPGPHPYPRARTTLDAMQTWNAPDRRGVLMATVVTGPDDLWASSRGATDLRETTVAAGCTGGAALLREYRVPAAWNQPAPGTQHRADAYNAYLEVPLGPMQRLAFEASARDTAERATLVPILQSACKLD
jgi:hypothetical protein